MSEFVEPKRVAVDVLGYFKEILANGLVKDLTEHQAICPTCKGTALVIRDSRYGLRGEGDPNRRIHFPYSNQYIIQCPNCYTGVVNLCPFCGKILRRGYTNCDGRGYLSCDCPAVRAKWEEEETAKENKALENAIKLEPEDPIAKDMGMFFSRVYSRNEGYFEDIEEFMEYWNDEEHEAHEKRPEYVWGTTSTCLELCADNMLSDACDDLHDEAYSRISYVDIAELQAFLDKWCEKHYDVTRTYSEYSKYAIRIPWETMKDKGANNENR
jgi:hypothetical protein